MLNCWYLVKILAIRAQVEELVVDEESLAYLGEMGQTTSLRYSKIVFGGIQLNSSHSTKAILAKVLWLQAI